jgi:adenosylcobinamide-GDP ribazoletransferase
MRALLASLQFLTLFPIRGHLEGKDFEKAPFFFPVIGLIFGGLILLADMLWLQLGFSPLLTSILLIGLLAVLNGGLHLDGLADTFDGFLSSRPRERVLEIMRDSNIGVMGTLALIFVLAIKITALSELTGNLRWRILIFTPIVGRCMMVAVMGLLAYARKSGGLASVFLGRTRRIFPIYAGLWLMVTAVLLFGLAESVVFVVASISITALFSYWSVRQIGGFTGDTLGATNEIVETTILLVAVSA